ncbi:MAG: aminopeptidase P family protein [Chlamydiia bacterium]|nr:aminopeptidase P family protein [Chlamydiia bacterium]
MTKGLLTVSKGGALRIEKARHLVAQYETDALLIEQPADIFYLTGQLCSSARMVLTKETATLLVDGRYYAKAEKTKTNYEVLLADKQALPQLLEGKEKIGFDSAYLTVDQYNTLQTSVTGKHWIPFAKPLKTLRVCKEAAELKALQKASRVTREGYQMIVNRLQEGVSEEELAFLFEVFCRNHGASGLAFEPIIAFGENSAYPHYRAGATRLKNNQIVLIDVGATLDHYQGDMTRVFFFGKPDPKLQRLYKIAQEAHDKALEKVMPGTHVGELDRIVHAHFAREGVEALFVHSLGHGVGLEVHEYPLVRAEGKDADLLLQEGMVFTIEPGLYVPGLGGVRYENTIAVTQNGYAPL